MRELVAGKLWIGNALDLRSDQERLLMHDVKAVVDLAYEEAPAALPRSLVYCRTPLLDDESNPPALIRLAVELTASLFSSETPTTVCCSAGLSRSPTVAALAVAVATAQDPNATLTNLLSGKPKDISPGFWKTASQACINLLP